MWPFRKRPPVPDPTTDPVRKAEAEIEKVERELKVSRIAIQQALRSPHHADRVRAFTDLYPIATPPSDVPDRMKLRDAIAADMKPHYEAAMDWSPGMPSVQLAGWHAVSEGVGFFGYPFLAELTQRAEYRMISEIRAEEMTRKWIRFTYQGEGDKSDVIDQIEDWFKRHQVRDKYRLLIEQDGNFGRAQLYIDTGATDDPDELKTRLIRAKAKIKKDSVVALRTVESLWTYPNRYNALDPLKPDYFKPEQWFVMGKLVHKSRLLTMVSRPMPDLLKAAYAFGGLSLAQMAKPYVDNWLNTRQSVSDLVRAFSTMILATDMSAVIQGGSATDLTNRVDLFNAFRGNFGTMIINKATEELTSINVPLGSLDKLQAQAQEHMSSVARTPLVKLLGITPSGLNASSDGEIRTFYDGIHAQQEKLLREPLHDLLVIAQFDMGLTPDPDIDFEFVELWELDEAGKALIRKTNADTAAVYIESGVIDQEEERQRIAKDPDSPWFGMDPDDVPDPPEVDTGTGETPSLAGDPAKTAEPRAELHSGV